MEQWRTIEGYPNYSVSNYGRVRNDLTCKILKQNLNSSGYYRVMIGGKQQFVHRLVAMAFIDNPNNYPVVNHLDYNPRNNHIDNLEWCTQSHNIQYSACNRNHNGQHGGRKMRKCEVDGLVFNCIADAEKYHNIKENCLCVYLRLGYNEYKGHKIKYLN